MTVLQASMRRWIASAVCCGLFCMIMTIEAVSQETIKAGEQDKIIIEQLRDQLNKFEQRLSTMNKELEKVQTDFQSFPKLNKYSLPSANQGSKNLGEHKFCALTTSGTSHAVQACTCVVDKEKDTWYLTMHGDRNVSGNCNCEAMCGD